MSESKNEIPVKLRILMEKIISEMDPLAGHNVDRYGKNNQAKCVVIFTIG